MKRILLLPVLLLVSMAVFAQGMTISVKSSTTIELEARSLTYTVPSIVADGMFGAMDIFEEDQGYEADLPWSLEEIADALSKNGYSYSKVNTENGPVYEVALTSREEVDALNELMQLLEVRGSVTDVAFENPAPRYPQLFQALSKDAQIQAKALADINGLVLLQLVSIKEVDQPAFDMSSYMDMFKEGGGMLEMFGMGGPALTKEYVKEMMFTYAVSY